MAQLHGYKWPLANSITSNLQQFGFNKVARAETLQEIIKKMGEGDGNGNGIGSEGPEIS